MGIRLLVCLCLGIFTLSLTAQNGTFFGTEVHLRDQETLNQQFSTYQVFELNAAALDAYARSENTAFDLNLRLGAHNWELELQPVALISPECIVRIATSSGVIAQNNTAEILTFKGQIRGIPNSQVRLTVHGDFVYGFIREGENTYFMEPADRFSPSAANNYYLVYNGEDVNPISGISCGVTDLQEHQLESGHGEGGSRVNDVYTELAIASDYLIYLEYGSINALINHHVGVLNNVAGDYDGAVFNNDVNFVIVEQFISTCASCDPWTSNTAAGTLLSDFASWGNAGGFNASYDLAQLWTDRDLDGGTVGIAYISGVCSSSFRYQVLQDYITNATSLRVLTSHETGHNFGAYHNYAIGSACDPPGRTVLIMDPTVSGATSWSTGIELCVDKVLGSITEINNRLAAVGCLSATAPAACPEVTNLSISSITATSISISWTDPGGSSTGFRVRLREEGAGVYLYDQTTTMTSLTVSPPLSLCNTYELLVETDCGGGTYSEPVTALFKTPFDTDFEITDVSTSNCMTGTPNGTYDLTVTFTHQGGNVGGFNINVDGVDHLFSFGSSPQTETITGLSGDGMLGNIVTIAAVTNGGGACDASATYDVPDNACNLFMRERFNTCQLPGGWTSTTTIGGTYVDPYEWKVGDATRNTHNYGAGTLDGSCMAYFDDDVNSNPSYTGIITLTTEAVDITAYQNTVVSFIYNFHNFIEGKNSANNSGTSQFIVDVWDGSSWQTVLTDNTDVCDWFNVWQAGCYESPAINVDAYRNANFQVRFTYTDGNDGSWAGMIALDDYLLSGDLSSALPIDLRSFTGQAEKEGVRLMWRTATEVNTDYFELQHSLDGRHFEAITQVAAAGNSTIQQEYQFLHTKPGSGINYYRLVLYNYDGSQSQEGTVTVQFQTESGMVIVPNPVLQQQFTVLWTSPKEEPLQADLFDARGKLVRNESYVVHAGLNQLPMENLDLPAGIYLLRVSQGNQKQTLRFVVL